MLKTLLKARYGSFRKLKNSHVCEFLEHSMFVTTMLTHSVDITHNDLLNVWLLFIYNITKVMRIFQKFYNRDFLYIRKVIIMIR